MTGLSDLPPTTAVADVLALRGDDGWLSPPLRQLVPGAAALGAATTVTLGEGAGGFGSLFALLSGDLTGQVVVVSSPSDDVAVWGELLTAAAAGRGAVAVLIAGAVRDVDACRDFGLPIWARAEATVGPAGGLEVVAVADPVAIGSRAVHDGDAVLVDAAGVVAVRPDVADDLFTAAHAYAEAEERVAADLAAGVPLQEAYRHKTEVVARLVARSA